MSDASTDQAKRIAEVNLRLSACRQMFGGQLDIFSGLSLVGNERDAYAVRMQLHAQLDAILDTSASLAKLIRTGSNLL